MGAHTFILLLCMFASGLEQLEGWVSFSVCLTAGDRMFRGGTREKGLDATRYFEYQQVLGGKYFAAESKPKTSLIRYFTSMA
jgi:hypothetical protein